MADTVKTPTITASEDSTKFTDSITVTYTVENATSATISVNGEEETYAEMASFVNTAGETIYTAEISGDATTATVVRMLPSGNVYNAVTFSVNQGKDYFTGDSTGLIFNNGAGSQTVDITDGLADGNSYMLSGSGSKLSVVAGTYQE